jgi:hypothetical protein
MIRVGLISSWDPKWVRDHGIWLEQYGPHKDGWWNRIGPENRRLLVDELARSGTFNFYAYSPVSKQGTGTVRHRFKVSDLEYHSSGILFVHEHGAHHDYGSGTARAILTLSELEKAPEPDLNRYVTVAGRSITPRLMQSMFCIRDQW